MKAYKETELYNQLRDNLQIRSISDYSAYKLIRTDVSIRFQRYLDTTDLLGDCKYISAASDALLKDALESVLRKCGIEEHDAYKIKMYDAAMKCYSDETYRSIPVTYLEIMYRMIVENAPHVLSPIWKDAFMAGIKEADRRAGRTND